MRPILFGVAGAFFFSFTYVLNRSMALEGGSWIWSASLRYLFLLPMMLPIVLWRGTFKRVLQEIRCHFSAWFFWSFVGFVVFYIPMTVAAAFVPAWFIAATWEITLIAGICMTPFFYDTVYTSKGQVRVRRKFPWRSLGLSGTIIIGVCLIQFENVSYIGGREVVTAFLLIAVAATAYPLGNRKMMEVTDGRLDALERVFGMTLVTLPWWTLLAVYGAAVVGLPERSQVYQSLWVALLVSLIATVLFFKATDMVKDNMHKLAGIEATQACEILFAILIEVVFLRGDLPSAMSWVGIFFILGGMLLYSYWIRKLS